MVVVRSISPNFDPQILHWYPTVDHPSTTSTHKMATNLFQSLQFAPNPDNVVTRGPPYLQGFMAMAWSAASSAGHSLAAANRHSHDLAARPLVWSKSKMSFTPSFADQDELVLGAGAAFAEMLAQAPQAGLHILAHPPPFLVYQAAAGMGGLLAGDDDFDSSTITTESEPPDDDDEHELIGVLQGLHDHFVQA